MKWALWHQLVEEYCLGQVPGKLMLLARKKKGVAGETVCGTVCHYDAVVE